MPTSLDSCIGATYEPGNIGASAGEPPIKPILPTTLDPENYDPESLTYSHNFSKFYNAAYRHHRTV